jgi:hypothetical protein
MIEPSTETTSASGGTPARITLRKRSPRDSASRSSIGSGGTSSGLNTPSRSR